MRKIRGEKLKPTRMKQLVTSASRGCCKYRSKVEMESARARFSGKRRSF
jgi:hypothetical protein